MNTAQKIIVGVLLLATLGFGALALSRNGSQPQPVTDSGDAIPYGSTLAPVNHYERGVWWFGGGFYVGSTQQIQLTSSGLLVQNSLQKAVSTVSCTANSVGTSTLFAVANPFAATSTATFAMLYGSGQATSTKILVGTSTASTGRTSSNVSPTFANMTIATSVPFFTAPGVTVGPGTGYDVPGAGTFRTVVVGPNEYVVGTATSTALAAGAAGYTAGLTSCTGAIEWMRI